MGGTSRQKKKRDNVKSVPICSKRNPTNSNSQKLKKTQRGLIHIKTNKKRFKIRSERNAVEDRQSWITKKSVNEASKRKSTSKTKTKAASQDERIQKWKEHFKNMLRKSFNLKIEKLLVSTKYSDNYGRQENLITYYFVFCNAIYNQNTIE